MPQFQDDLSLCIPNVYISDELRLRTEFESRDIGHIDSIKFIKHPEKSSVCIAIVHFKSWNNTATTRHLQALIVSNNTNARLYYDIDKYWSLSTIKKPVLKRHSSNNVLAPI